MGTLVFQATLGGQVNLTGPNTASTFTISVPAVTGTMITSGDTGTVTSTMISGPITTAKGGTGLTSFTANGVVYASSTSALTTGSALTFDGTAFSVSGTANNALNVTSTATTTALKLDNTNANGWGSNLAINTGGVAAGYFGTIGSLLGSTSQDLAVYATAGNGFRVYTNGNNERMRLDSSGNFGLGVTPSTWNTITPVQVKNASFAGYTATTYVGSNWYYGSGDKYITSTGALLYTQDGNTSAHKWYNAPSGTAGNAITFTQAMTLDASGNLLVGTTSSTYSAAGRGVIEVNGSSTSIMALKIGGSAAGYTYHDGSVLSLVNTLSGPLAFATSGTERARIDSIGNMLVGTTSQVAQGKISVVYSNTVGQGLCFNENSGSGLTRDAVRFQTSGTQVGSISVSTTATAYLVASDYRLKTVIGAVSGSGERIDALEPVEYTWNSNGSRTRGFLAHQFQEVYADSVTGTKDAIDADGKPVYQQMQASTSEVIADLVAEIQSLRKRLAIAGI